MRGVSLGKGYKLHSACVHASSQHVFACVSASKRTCVQGWEHALLTWSFNGNQIKSATTTKLVWTRQHCIHHVTCFRTQQQQQGVVLVGGTHSDRVEIKTCRGRFVFVPPLHNTKHAAKQRRMDNHPAAPQRFGLVSSISHTLQICFSIFEKNTCLHQLRAYWQVPVSEWFKDCSTQQG